VKKDLARSIKKKLDKIAQRMAKEAELKKLDDSDQELSDEDEEVDE
jgi:hypothetical protein